MTSKLEYILKGLQSNTIFHFKEPDLENNKNKAKEEIKQLFQEMIDEVIGENMFDRNEVGSDKYKTGWNDRMTEQQQRAKELLEEL